MRRPVRISRVIQRKVSFTVIPNPQNKFEQLQNEVATQLMSVTPFNNIQMPDGSAFQVLTEDEGDIQFQFEQMLSYLGLSVVVHAAEGDVLQPDIPGPLISKVTFDIWVTEAPTFNRSERGTKVRVYDATATVMNTIHLFEPASLGSPVYALGFKKDRQRNYANENDRKGLIWLSRICKFATSQVPPN